MMRAGSARAQLALSQWRRHNRHWVGPSKDTKTKGVLALPNRHAACCLLQTPELVNEPYFIMCNAISTIDSGRSKAVTHSTLNSWPTRHDLIMDVLSNGSGHDVCHVHAPSVCQLHDTLHGCRAGGV